MTDGDSVGREFKRRQNKYYVTMGPPDFETTVILHPKICKLCNLSTKMLSLSILLALLTPSSTASDQMSDRLYPRRRQSQATLLSHKQNLITGSANSPLTSPYNQFYFTNNVNSPHNGKWLKQGLIILN